MKPCHFSLFALFLYLSLASILQAANGIIPGAGTEQNPYIIEDIDDFETFRDSANASTYWDTNIYTQLASDIDLTGLSYGAAVIAPDPNSEKGFQGTSYKGIFDGNGCIISNLEISNFSNDFLGLFGMIDAGAVVKKLGLENINITTDSSTFNVGGLAAQNSGTISHCYTKGTINASNNVGGLCGTNDTGTITNCYSTASMIVTESADKFGGFCGYNRNNSLIDKCFFAGNVTHGSSSIGLNSFCGYNAAYSTITNSFWDSDVCDWLADEGYATELSTAEMQTKSTYTDAGWDFSYSDGTLADWIIYPNNYPQLFWENTIAYTGITNMSKPVGTEIIEIKIDIFCPIVQTVDWTLTGFEASDIIENVFPTSGTSNGPADITTVTITYSDLGLPVGDYFETLTINANTDSIDVPLELHIYNPVGMIDFANLAQFWLLTGCDLPAAPCAAADFLMDGTVNISDLDLLAANWLAKEIPFTTPVIFDGFESADFSKLPWANDPITPWTIADDSVNTGTYSAKSGTLTLTQSSTLTLTIDSDYTNISFSTKVQCPSVFSSFYFLIDDAMIDTFQGVTDWQDKSYEINPGTHTFQWVYANWIPDSDTNKCAWIDDVTLH